jgi:hypothetical protein
MPRYHLRHTSGPGDDLTCRSCACRDDVETSRRMISKLERGDESVLRRVSHYVATFWCACREREIASASSCGETGLAR